MKFIRASKLNQEVWDEITHLVESPKLIEAKLRGLVKDDVEYQRG
jgi:hypothetical protein